MVKKMKAKKVNKKKEPKEGDRGYEIVISDSSSDVYIKEESVKSVSEDKNKKPRKKSSSIKYLAPIKQEPFYNNNTQNSPNAPSDTIGSMNTNDLKKGFEEDDSEIELDEDKFINQNK